MSNNKKYTNHLIKEYSPYLLQHAHNPVNWYPWKTEVLEKAKTENKLILISIGYSACHWCHVMERESFENEEIAKIMNDHFVCIKVDREERPDIDQIYMNAVQLITGSGGWPLNCFALPNGNPVFGGTYFKPDQWKDILQNLARGYEVDKERFEKYANELKQGIVSNDKIIKIKQKTAFAYEDILNIILKTKKQFDRENGGTVGSPKFPLPVNYFFLMRFYYHSGEIEVLQQIMLTLKKMAKGGIYDQLGGGFSRYSVDSNWLVPHFEKMLYDNAQLVSLYSEAYRLNPDAEYKKIVYETLRFVENELTSPEGGFFSSIDADSEGVEGKYYVWDKSEVQSILKENADVFCDYYDITTNGNWEGKNILNRNNNDDDIASRYKLTIDELEKIIFQAKRKLFQQRLKRVKPALDDKILTSWNALMIKAFADAYNVFNDEDFLKIAEKNFKFIESNLINDDYSLFRSNKNKKSTINAFLDDYVLLVDALIGLYHTNFNEYYINTALKITEYIIQHFYDKDSGMFFYTSDRDSQLIARIKEVNDNVISSSNSVMAQNLFKLGHYFIKEEYIKKAEQMLRNIKEQIIKYPYYFGNWIDLMIQFIHKPYEVCIMGNKSQEIKKDFFRMY
ncbi:MAG TPA: thioredoxin domain-containing protein, partial [Bacteroidales bacterium]|nr:thioredoxin domain-containing protein [Bacteroidales bacterium]